MSPLSSKPTSPCKRMVATAPRPRGVSNAAVEKDALHIITPRTLRAQDNA
jgi:hypothetical protein